MAVYTRADVLASVGTGFEPQRQHNFAVELNLDNDLDTITLSLAQGFLPTGYNEDVPIPFGNETVYVAGKAVWEAGTLILRDWIDRPTAKLIQDWRNEVYNPITGAIGLATNYKRNASIVLFGPNVESGSADGGARQRIWTLFGCWPVRFNPAANSLDMTTSGYVLMELIVRYDKALADFGNYSPRSQQ